MQDDKQKDGSEKGKDKKKKKEKKKKKDSSDTEGEEKKKAKEVKKEEKPEDEEESRPKLKFKVEVNYEYFDPGNHWCRLCNHVCGNVLDLCHHLRSKKHEGVRLLFVVYFACLAVAKVTHLKKYYHNNIIDIAVIN